MLPITRDLNYNKFYRYFCSKRSVAKYSKSTSENTKRELNNEPKKDGQIKLFKVYRFAGVKSKEKPKIQTFSVDTAKCGGMLLDALLKIKDMDPTFSFRRSCREGVCGSCAVNLQGTNVLACLAPIPKQATVSIYPLPHMYVIRDLVVDTSHFFDGYKSIRPFLIRSKPIELGSSQYAQSIKDIQKMIGKYECVLCGCCSTACPSYWWNGRRFLGPAALLHAYRWVMDSRDEATISRLYHLRDDFKAFRCHSIMNCSVVCPKGLQPGKEIAHLKRMIAKLSKKPAPEIDPMSHALNVKDASFQKKICQNGK